MNCNQNSGYPPRRPCPMPNPMANPNQVPNPMPCSVPNPMLNPNPPYAGSCRPDGRMEFRPPAGFDRYPIGMGYVPMQNWETPYPMGQGFCKGTIFPSLDYPFVMGRCRR